MVTAPPSCLRGHIPRWRPPRRDGSAGTSWWARSLRGPLAGRAGRCARGTVGWRHQRGPWPPAARPSPAPPDRTGSSVGRRGGLADRRGAPGGSSRRRGSACLRARLGSAASRRAVRFASGSASPHPRPRDLSIPWAPPQPDHHTLWSLKSDAPGGDSNPPLPSLSPCPARGSPAILHGAARGCDQHPRTT
jgi:hypothetical protein